MPNTYSDLTLSAAETIVAQWLAETFSSSYVRFLQDEIDTAIIEAIRSWNSLTGYHQDTQSVVIPANTVFIDVPSIFPAPFREYSVLDFDLIAAISYHLFEPKSTSSWVGSDMFTYPQIIDAIQRRRNQFILETGCRITYHDPAVDFPLPITPGSGEVGLDQAIVDIRRAAWKASVDGKITPLWPSSNWALRGASNVWNLSPGLPRIYAFNQRAPYIVQLAPPNIDNGVLDLLTVDTLPPDNLGSGILIGIPDDFTPWVKWGVLADLLSSDGPAKDYARALYCERRYQLGVAATQSANMLIDARINDKIAQFAPISSLDAAPNFRYWQSRTSAEDPTGLPRYLSPIGLNMLALVLPPATSVSLELTAVRNALIPDTANPNTSYLQIGREYMDVVLGYAMHLLMFKVGGQEFAATTQLADAFFQAANDYRGRLAVSSIYEDDQRGISGKQEEIKPRRVQRQTGESLR